jgi:hypothetical protein
MKVWKGEIEVIFRAHAIFRASERNVPWELIETTIQRGSFEEFGKDMVRISKACNKGRLMMIGKKYGAAKLSY